MIRTFHRSIAAASVLALAAIVILLLGPPARAAEDRLLVGNSPEGPFLRQLPSPLFSGVGLLVPGDGVTRTFWIKNASGDPAFATVTMADRQPATEFGAAVAFGLRIGGPTPRGGEAAADGDGCFTVSNGSIPPGGVQPVHVTASVADMDGQTGTGQETSADMLVTLTQDPGNGGIEVCGEEATNPPGSQGHTDDETADTADPGDAAGVDCSRDVVVTTTGTPTCLPTAVAAGASGSGGLAGVLGDGDSVPGPVAAPYLALLGGLLLALAHRRRRTRAEARVQPRHRRS